MPSSEHAGQRGAGTARFIDPAVLSRIKDLELLARTVVDGFVAGMHRSPYLGFSLDFAEHRAYMPGDDIRNIDWRLFARTDRFFVKQYEAETNANVVLAVDVSGSMGYGSGVVTKLDYARFLGAALAFMSGRQRDRIGLTTFGTRPRDVVPPAVSHMDRVLHGLDRAVPEGEGELAEGIHRVGSGISRRGILVLVSDLYGEADRLVETIRSLRFRGQDVIVFQVLDPAELDFPFDDAAMFTDAETGETIPVVPDAVREEYRERLGEHLETLEKQLTGGRIDYALLNTSDPLDEALFRYLSIREKKARVR